MFVFWPLHKRVNRRLIMSISNYPVEHISPALRCDALKDCEHGKAKVVKMGDAKVGTRPTCPTFSAIDGAAAPVSSLSTGRWLLILPECNDI